MSYELLGFEARISRTNFFCLVSGWTVDIVADSLPNADPTRYPTKENIVSSSPQRRSDYRLMLKLDPQRRYIQALLKDNKAGDQFVIVCELASMPPAALTILHLTETTV